MKLDTASPAARGRGAPGEAAGGDRQYGHLGDAEHDGPGHRYRAIAGKTVIYPPGEDHWHGAAAERS